jgi:transposase-like protein
MTHTPVEKSTAVVGDRSAHYVKLLDEFERRGGSLAAFAAERGLSAWTLYGWRRRLGRVRRRSKRTSSLVAVDVLEPVAPARSEPEAVSAFELIMSDGCRVRVPGNFSTRGLRELLSVLRSC